MDPGCDAAHLGDLPEYNGLIRRNTTTPLVGTANKFDGLTAAS